MISLIGATNRQLDTNEKVLTHKKTLHNYGKRQLPQSRETRYRSFSVRKATFFYLTNRFRYDTMITSSAAKSVDWRQH